MRELYNRGRASHDRNVQRSVEWSPKTLTAIMAKMEVEVHGGQEPTRTPLGGRNRRIKQREFARICSTYAAKLCGQLVHGSNPFHFVPRFRALSASCDYGFKESLFHDMEGNNGRHCTCVKSCHNGSMQVVGDVKMEEACQVEARKVEWQASRSFLS